MENERDEAKQEAKVARVAASAVGNAMACAEEDLPATKEGKRKVNAMTVN